MTTTRSRACYAWGGRQVDGNFTACDLSTTHSMCCRLNLPSDHYAPDGCLPNGLCSYFGNSLAGLPTQAYWIESCTDRSWQDPVCASLAKYVDPSSDTGCYRNDDGNAPLGYCPQSGVYCCNKNVYIQNTTSCCDANVKDNVFVRLAVASIAAVTTSYQSSYYTTFLPTMVSTSLPASSSGPMPTSSSTEEGGLSTGAGVGIGIVAALGFVAIVSGAFFVLRKLRGRKSDPAMLHITSEKHQMPAHAPSQEMPGDTSRHELS